jgi:hypothetical protein
LHVAHLMYVVCLPHPLCVSMTGYVSGKQKLMNLGFGFDDDDFFV